MTVLAIVRASDVNPWLFLHVLGAMVLVGAVTLSMTALVGAGRSENLPLTTRLAFRSLLWVALPAFFVMRVFAEVTVAQEHLDDLPEDPTWLGIGYPIGDFSLLLLIAAIIVTWRGTRRAERDGTKSGLTTAGLVLAVLLLVLYVVAIWAMTVKPD
jgi:hypothetical protein